MNSELLRWCFRLTVLIAWVAPSVASAGPPGALDDPFAIGTGNIEFIVAASAAEQSGEIGIDGPIFDITMGVTERLDFLVAGQAFHVVEGGEKQAEAGIFMTGFKWQALAGPLWNGAWTPGVVVEIQGEQRVAMGNHFQLERSLGRFSLGTDVGYIWVDDGSHLARGGLYGLFAPSDRLTLMAEVWFENSPEPLGVTLGLGQADPDNRATDVSFNLGFDWEVAEYLRVLASAGTGIASHGRERIGWQGYFGLQWLWGAPANASDPPLMARRRRH